MGEFILVAMAAFQQTHWSHSGEKPGKLGYFWYVGLTVKKGFLGIQAAREKVERNIKCIRTAGCGIKERSHRMVVGNKIKCLTLVLQLDAGLHHPKIIPDMQRSRWLNAG